MNSFEMMRELAAIELDQVGGGIEFHPFPGPTEPFIPPHIIVSGPPSQPGHGPVVPPNPTPITFSAP